MVATYSSGVPKRLRQKPAPPSRSPRKRTARPVRGGRRRLPAGGGALPTVRTRTEMVQAIFKHADEDEDGFLNADEFAQLQCRLGHAQPSEEQWEDICAILRCDPAVGIAAPALQKLYELSESSEEADYMALPKPREPQPKDADLLSAARLEDDAHRRAAIQKHGPTPPQTQRHKNDSRTAGMRTTYSKSSIACSNLSDADKRARRAHVPANYGSVLHDAAGLLKQTGQVEKANLVEQACAYVKQEATAVKAAAFAMALERLSARAHKKTEEVEAKRVREEAERARQQALTKKRAEVRLKQKAIQDEERQTKISRRQEAARLLNESTQKRAVEQRELLVAMEKHRKAEQSIIPRKREIQRKRQERLEQQRLTEMRQERTRERAEVEARKVQQELELEAARKKRALELMDRQLQRAKIEALRDADMEAMQYAMQQVAAEQSVAEEVEEEPEIAVVPQPEPSEDSNDASVELAPLKLVSITSTDLKPLEIIARRSPTVSEEGGTEKAPVDVAPQCEAAVAAPIVPDASTKLASTEAETEATGVRLKTPWQRARSSGRIHKEAPISLLAVGRTVAEEAFTQGLIRPADVPSLLGGMTRKSKASTPRATIGVIAVRPPAVPSV